MACDLSQHILNNQKSPAGFTIIEVLFSLAVFSIGFLAVSVIQTKGIHSATFSREKTEALNIAKTQSERLMAMKFYVDDNGEDDDLDGGIDFYDLNPGLAAGSFSDNTGWTRGVYGLLENCRRCAAPRSQGACAIPAHAFKNHHPVGHAR